MLLDQPMPVNCTIFDMLNFKMLSNTLLAFSRSDSRSFGMPTTTQWKHKQCSYLCYALCITLLGFMIWQMKWTSRKRKLMKCWRISDWLVENCKRREYLLLRRSDHQGGGTLLLTRCGRSIVHTTIVGMHDDANFVECVSRYICNIFHHC